MPPSVRITKRVLDFLISLFVLILLSPLLLLVALAIKIDSRGSIFYKQERVAKSTVVDDGSVEIKTFWIYKFRTMGQDAEKQTGAVNATENDPRVTRIGKIIRPMRIDEIPNLINVLRGEMSIVGPRADRVEIFEQVQDEFPMIWHRSQFVKPGITGSAQLALRSDGSVKDNDPFVQVVSPSDIDKPVDSFRFKLYYDFAYVVRMMSFWSFVKTDLTIMAKTPYTMFIRKNTI